MNIILTDEDRRTLQRFTFAAPHRTIAGLSGEHRSRKRGPSPEFADFKTYTPGDDYRRIDWNTYARLDHLFIRESETTTEHSIHLILDNGPSMDWAGDDSPQTKLAAGGTALAMLAWIGIWHFDRVALQTLHGPTPVWGPFQGRGRVASMLEWFQRVQPHPADDTATSLRRFVRSRRRPGRLLIATDALELDIDILRDTLKDAASRLWQVTILRVDDPLERDPEPLFGEEPVLELRTDSRSRMQVSGAASSIDTYREHRAAWLADLAALDDIPGVHIVPIDRARSDVLAMLQQLAETGVLRR
jgi:uncharacterized protein (DUF58 family)